MFLTIFTPTYNRKHLLTRLYRSLCAQQCLDFEWLVVDDGSTDGSDSLISDFIAEEKITITSIWKENGGKHTAHNMALKYAQGEYFFTVDSDDWLPEDAVFKIKQIIDLNQGEIELSGIAGILALKSYSNGNTIGKVFSHDKLSSTLYELEHNGNKGERSIIFKTSVLKLFPFPVICGESFMTECVVYDQIDQKYKFFVTNDNLAICEYQPEGLSSNPKRLMYKNPGGFSIYFTQRFCYALNFREILKYGIQANCFKYLYRGHQSYIKVHKHKLLYFLSKPLGWLATIHYKSFAK